MKPKVGQFWRDTVNGDLLKILAFSQEMVYVGADRLDDGRIEYVRCACFPLGKYLMGIQEMKTSTLTNGRFKKVGLVKSLWYRWKFKNIK